MNMQKAQGTIEYLIIIAIVIVIALVVVGLLVNQTNSISAVSGSTSKLSSYSQELAVKEFIVNADGNALIILQNNSSGIVNIESISIGGANRGVGGTQLVSVGEKTFSLKNISNNCNCTNLAGQKKNCELKISYTTTNGLTKTILINTTANCETTATPTNATHLTGECITNSDCDSEETCIIGGTSAQNKCYSDVVGYWKLEGNTVDSSPNGNDGIDYGGITYLTGKIGQDINFNGTNDYVTTNVPIYAATSSDLQTFSGWLYFNGTTADIFGSDAGIVGQIHIYASLSSTNVYFGPTWFGGGDSDSTYNTTVSIGWHQIVIVKIAAGTYDVYYDGSKVISSVTRTANLSSNLNLGRHYTGYNLYGSVDEVTVFDRALSSSEIMSLYKAQSGLNEVECTTNSDCASGSTCIIGSESVFNKCYSGVAGYWRFENDADDYSSNGNNGVNHGATLAPAGKIGGGYSFDGSEEKYINVVDTDTLTFNDGTTESPFTISSWFNANDWSGGGYQQNIIVAKDNLNSREYSLSISGGGGGGHPVFSIYQNNDACIMRYSTWTAALSTETWYNIVGVYDGSKTLDGLKIYVDGERYDDTSASWETFTGMINSSVPFSIGAIRTDGAGPVVGALNGTLDEVVIMNKELSAAEVGILYNAQVGN